MRLKNYIVVSQSGKLRDDSQAVQKPVTRLLSGPDGNGNVVVELGEHFAPLDLPHNVFGSKLSPGFAPVTAVAVAS